MNNLMAIFPKLLAVQKAIKPIIKDAINPHFRNHYFDVNSLLSELKPLLSEQGLILLQPLTHLNGVAALMTRVIDAESGELIEDTVPLPVTTDPQKFGSACSYLRRYALTSLFALEGEIDDDANTASKPVYASPVPSTVKVHTLGQEGEQEPIYEGIDPPKPFKPGGVTDATELNTCSECGKPCKKPFTRCYSCKMGNK